MDEPSERSEAGGALERIAQMVAAGASAALPRYERLARAIGAEIDSGRWGPGDQLPADSAFAKELPFSLGTIQKALKRLEDDGVVVRRYRVGTFVRDRKLRDSDVRHLRFLFPGEKAIAPLTVRTIDISPAKTANAWGEGIEAMGPLVRIRRICTVGIETRLFLETYLRADQFGSLLDVPLADMSATPLSTMLGEKFNAPTLRTDHRFRLVAANEAARKWLDLPRGAPVIDWRMYCYSYDDVLIMAQRVMFPQTHCSLQIVEVTSPA